MSPAERPPGLPHHAPTIPLGDDPGNEALAAWALGEAARAIEAELPTTDAEALRREAAALWRDSSALTERSRERERTVTWIDRLRLLQWGLAAVVLLAATVFVGRGPASRLLAALADGQTATEAGTASLLLTATPGSALALVLAAGLGLLLLVHGQRLSEA